MKRSSPSSCSSKSLGFPSPSGGGSLSAAIFASSDRCARGASRTCHVSNSRLEAGARAGRQTPEPRLPGPPLVAPPSRACPASGLHRHPLEILELSPSVCLFPPPRLGLGSLLPPTCCAVSWKKLGLLLPHRLLSRSRPNDF